MNYLIMNMYFFNGILIRFGYQALTLFVFLAFQNTVQAQKGWIAGAGPSVELDQGLYGINARLFYGINSEFCFGPEIAYFPYATINDEHELRVTDLNFNAHYIFEVTERLGLYPLTGINYTIEKERMLESASEYEKKEEFGWNYGFGLHYNLNNIFVFGEFKGIVGSLNDEFMTIGVIFNIFKESESKEVE
ncbi:outer membrane beta-barrel protein [Flagellimonas sp. 2504JD4-2]